MTDANAIDVQGDFCSQDYVLVPGGFDTTEDDDTDTDRYCGVDIQTIRDPAGTLPGTVVSKFSPEKSISRKTPFPTF